MSWAVVQKQTIVIADIKNFAPLDESRRRRLFLLNNWRVSAYSV